MNEVEKMYENAGIEKVYEYVGHYPKTDENGIILPMVYPPFTAEKQIELIKWFVTNNAELETLEITYYLNDCFQISSCTKSSHFETNFDDALAGLINNLWQDLTDAERTQIKETLE